ncbi:hypothetical protein BDF20DRAFT_558669 [Mycotypha africana]|uniref:uncharacterized protein n=1 Tax=Mycotypha africana TaxID=64632 RepID=UPI0023009863|nr:uncharacterized protein BDF20DRAFT_558669 [Mycotypha africana]KAI8977316.1 hypothetical protein BDF20DRAFT_558669 [Mycotypha africana]
MADLIVSHLPRETSDNKQAKQQQQPISLLSAKSKMKPSVLITQIKDRIPVPRRSNSAFHPTQQRNHTIQLPTQSRSSSLTDKKLPIRSKSLPRKKQNIAENDDMATVKVHSHGTKNHTNALFPPPNNSTTTCVKSTTQLKSASSVATAAPAVLLQPVFGHNIVVPPQRSSSLRRNRSHTLSNTNTTTITTSADTKKIKAIKPPIRSKTTNSRKITDLETLSFYQDGDLFSPSVKLWGVEDNIFGSMENLILPAKSCSERRSTILKMRSSSSSNLSKGNSGTDNHQKSAAKTATVATEEKEATAESVARSFWYHYSPLANDDNDSIHRESNVDKKNQVRVSEIPDTEIAGYLGKMDTFSHQVLLCYMGFFDFSNLTLDEAFRKLCAKLYLKAEAQEIDRILEAFSNRYYETLNLDHQSILRNADIVYTTTYSMMLLNTDLHHMSHLSHCHNAMTCEAFVKNTMYTILEQQGLLQQQQLLSSSPSQELSSMIQQQRQHEKEDPNLAFWKWKEQLENFLREIFFSIKQHGVMLPSAFNNSSIPSPPSTAASAILDNGTTTAAEAAKVFIKRMGSMSRRRRVIREKR